MRYNKKVTSVEEQLQQLTERGLSIDDPEVAQRWLLNVSYYRLAGYWWPMQADKVLHTFKPNSRFSDVVALYEFDRELRLLLFGVIERIEIALRTKLIHFLSLEHGFWWFTDISRSADAKSHAKNLSAILGELERSKEVFITEHNKKYRDDERFPPAHKTLETASMGTLSKIYGNLHNAVRSKNKIAQEFGTVNHSYLHSWLQTITQIRNICAHHGRLWNRNLPGTPKLMPMPPDRWISKVPSRNEYHMLYVHLCCMKYLLNRIDDGYSFSARLIYLLDQYPNVDHKALGLKKDWQNEPLWQ